MENIVVIKPWLENLRCEINEALQKYVGKTNSLKERACIYLTINNIVDKYMREGHFYNTFNVWKYLDFNLNKKIEP